MMKWQTFWLLLFALLVAAAVGWSARGFHDEGKRVHAQAQDTPAAASGVSLNNQEFELSVDGVQFDQSTDSGGSGDAANYWSNRGLAGAKAVTFDFNIDKVAGPESTRFRSYLANVCRVEARYQTRESGGLWQPLSRWQVVTWAAWDQASQAITDTTAPSHTIGGGTFDAEDYFYGGDSTGRTAGGRIDNWGHRYTGRKLAGRLPLPAESDWDGEDREFRFHFRLIWGTAAKFQTFYTSNAGGQNRHDFLDKWPANSDAGVCDFYAQGQEWQDGGYGAQLTVNIDSIIPNFTGGARGALRTLATAAGARVVLTPTGGIDYAGADTATSTTAQWRYLQACGDETPESCSDVSGNPAWGDMAVARQGQEWTFKPESGYWRFEYRLQTDYGGGRATEMRFPALTGNADAPLRVGRIEPQNRTRWLNGQERGLTTWYKGAASDQPGGFPAYSLNVWDYGEGEIIDGAHGARGEIADFPPPYLWDRRFSQDVVLALPTSTAPAGVLPLNGVQERRGARLLAVWLGGDDPLSRADIATGDLINNANPNIFWESYLNNDQYANRGVRLNIIRGRGTRAKVQFDTQDERRLYILAYQGCQYAPGTAWDRYAVQTQQAYNWRLFANYECSGQPARQVGGATSTTYASAGLEVQHSASYIIKTHNGGVGLYQGNNPVPTIDGNAGEKLAFLEQGIYDILLSRSGGYFDVEFTQTQDAPLTRLINIPRGAAAIP